MDVNGPTQVRQLSLKAVSTALNGADNVIAIEKLVQNLPK